MLKTYSVLNLEETEKFVQLNENAWWENYDLIIWKKNPGAWSKKNGKMYNGNWGTILRIPVSTEGTWRVPTGVKPI
jgi:hypothetical protein